MIATGLVCLASYKMPTLELGLFELFLYLLTVDIDKKYVDSIK